MSPPCPSIPIQGWKEPQGGTGNGLFIELVKVPQGFAGHNLVGVDEAKPDCSHTLGFSEVGELFTLSNVNGNLTPLDAMLLILTALILGTIFDSEFLQGGMQDSGKTFNVQTITTNTGSCQPWRWLQRRTVRKARSKEKLDELKCTKWWYQWLSQALLIKAERAVVLVWSTRVPTWDHYE